jgi:hypothetical protein
VLKQLVHIVTIGIYTDESVQAAKHPALVLHTSLGAACIRIKLNPAAFPKIVCQILIDVLPRDNNELGKAVSEVSD